MQGDLKRRGQPDFLIMLITVILVGIGLVMVYSASHVHAFMRYNDGGLFLKRQAFFAILGFIVLIITMNIPYKLYRKLILLILLVLVILMGLVLTSLGVERGGAQRWLDLGFINIQPSEFVKIGIIIYLAAIYSKKQEYINQFGRGVIPPLVIVAIFFILILLQRDLGTGMAVIIFTVIMIFCSGARMIHIMGLGLVCSIIFITFAMTQEYRWSRITAFQDPWADPLGSGYQLIQSLYAIGNGGVSGSGLGNSTQKYLYLPEAHTDFIFAITAEEVGFVGVVFILILYTILIIRGIQVSNRAPDAFGNLLGIGIVSMIGVQTMINIAVVSGLAPVTGIALPFISYGGSSLLLNLISIGILLNISRCAGKDIAANVQ